MPETATIDEAASSLERKAGLRCLLLLNRKARQSTTHARAAVDRLRMAGFDLTVLSPEHPAQLSKTIRDRKSYTDLVVIGGGDGTLNRAAAGLVDAKLPLGILPLGTANDLARTLGLPNDPLQAADVIVNGRKTQIDLGWVNGSYFFNVASIGMATGVTRRLGRLKKTGLGILAYPFAAVQAAFQARPFVAEIRSRLDTLRSSTVQITIGNGRHYGGGMTVHADAQIDDGLFHLFVLEVSGWWQVLPLLPALRSGTLEGCQQVRTLQGTEFEVRTFRRSPRTITADGEIVGRTPASFRLLPRVLTVIVPN